MEQLKASRLSFLADAGSYISVWSQDDATPDSGPCHYTLNRRLEEHWVTKLWTAFRRPSGEPTSSDNLFVRWLVSTSSPWASITTHNTVPVEEIAGYGFEFPDVKGMAVHPLLWKNFFMVSRLAREAPTLVDNWAKLVGAGVLPCVALVAAYFSSEADGRWSVRDYTSLQGHAPFHTSGWAIVRNLSAQSPNFAVSESHLLWGHSGPKNLFEDLPPPSSSVTGLLRSSSASYYSFEDITTYLLKEQRNAA